MPAPRQIDDHVMAPTPEKPKKRGRGTTGKPKGRPPGSLNKPKVPDDGLPKVPRRRGRPPGSRNKPKVPDNGLPTPSGAHSAYPTPADSNSSSTESENTFAPTSTKGRTKGRTNPVRPQPTPLNGYAPPTEFSESLDPHDRAWDPMTGWYSVEGRARELEANTLARELDLHMRASAPLPSTSTAPGNFITPTPPPGPLLTHPTHANPLAPGQPYYGNGYQDPSPYESRYPNPARFALAFRPGNFVYGNDNNSSPYYPSGPYPQSMPAQRAPTPHSAYMTGYAGHSLPPSTTPQAYDASHPLTGADNNIPKLRPRSSIAPNPNYGPQVIPSAPATLEPADIDLEPKINSMLASGAPAEEWEEFLDYDATIIN